MKFRYSTHHRPNEGKNKLKLQLYDIVDGVRSMDPFDTFKSLVLVNLEKSIFC